MNRIARACSTAPGRQERRTTEEPCDPREFPVPSQHPVTRRGARREGRFLLASVWPVLAALLLFQVGLARVDALKESIYVMSLHIGAANGTLFGLAHSYVTTKAVIASTLSTVFKTCSRSSATLQLEVNGPADALPNFSGSTDLDRLAASADSAASTWQRGVTRVLLSPLDLAPWQL